MAKISTKKIEKPLIKPPIAPDEVDADMWDIERKIPVLSDFNTTKGIYEESIFTGLNNEKSIFDKTAIFHTKKDEI